jgi:hypothetical protein
MSSEESSRKTAANMPAHREQETATHAQSKPKDSEGGKWPLPFDDGSREGEVNQSDDPQGGKIDIDM